MSFSFLLDSNDSTKQLETQYHQVQNKEEIQATSTIFNDSTRPAIKSSTSRTLFQTQRMYRYYQFSNTYI